MEFDAVKMVGDQAARFLAAFPDAGELIANVYGVVFLISALTALITLGFVVFKRESGGTSASLIVQWLIVWMIPVIGPIFTGETVEEATRFILSLV